MTALAGKYFFDSGCASWFDDIAAHTFSSTFCTLEPAEARIIVIHWEQRRRVLAASAARGFSGDGCDEEAAAAELATLLADATAALQPLVARLETAVQAECAKSTSADARSESGGGGSGGLAFVKLSTRSPKDSKKALARAAAAFQRRMGTCAAEAAAASPPTPPPDHNDRWVALSEEVGRASAVRSAAAALELLLDSERVYEDLEYALRGPPLVAGAASPVQAPDAKKEGTKELQWNMSLVARAWDERLTPRSEFRGVVWGDQLTCLCQYFHPLHFPGLRAQLPEIEADLRATFAAPAVHAAVAKMGGHCIIDFAWLGPGETVVIELNPFDGVCLGTFPASTGLFLWEDAADRRVMEGKAPFEFRLRDAPLGEHELLAQCNRDWRGIVKASEAVPEATHTLESKMRMFVS